MLDWLIVGCGFTGCVLARAIADGRGERVLLVDRRSHIGGNAHDRYNDHGVLVHEYGPHIFHTNAARVWSFLSRFTQWHHYQHRVRAVVEGKEVPLPFNLDSIHASFPATLATELERKLIAEFGFNQRVPILKLRTSRDSHLSVLAEYVYENVFETYSRKHWGVSPEELSPAVTARVPVSISRDDRYFRDTYQGLPLHGYTRMFELMLRHPKIKLLLNTDYSELPAEMKSKKVIFTGPVDEYFDYRCGELPYRSVRFEHRTLSQPAFQSVGTINYPMGYDFTRITEQRILTGQKHEQTTLIYEYPQAHERGQNEAYYPVPSDHTEGLRKQYKELADELRGRVWLAGRLGTYRYLNMDHAVAQALHIYDNQIA